MARNSGVTVRAAVSKLSDAQAVQLAASITADYREYLEAVTPGNAASVVADSATTIRARLVEALTPAPV